MKNLVSSLGRRVASGRALAARGGACALASVLGLCGALLLAGDARAQNLFAPVVKVNDQVVTAYELSQRTAFMTLLGARGNVKSLAQDRLIEERLQQEAARRMGISLTEEMMLAGMTEFAGRANMKVDQFVGALAQAGVAKETFRDFVGAGMIWREVVRARFVPRVQVSEAEIDRAIAQGLTGPDGKPTGPMDLSVEYAVYLLPGGDKGRATAEKLRDKVDTCDDLYGVAKGQPEERLMVETQPVASIPARYAGELALLDAGEVSTRLTAVDGSTVFLMLCGRTRALPEEISREDVMNQLRNQRLQAYANSYMSELKADAIISYPGRK